MRETIIEEHSSKARQARFACDIEQRRLARLEAEQAMFQTQCECNCEHGAAEPESRQVRLERQYNHQ